jgi:hypothetical protein
LPSKCKAWSSNPSFSFPSKKKLAEQNPQDGESIEGEHLIKPEILRKKQSQRTQTFLLQIPVAGFFLWVGEA